MANESANKSSNQPNTRKSNGKIVVDEKKANDIEQDNSDNDENYDDSESFQTSNSKTIDGIISNSNSLSMNMPANSSTNNALKLIQITKLISPKWPNRVFAVELIRRIIEMCIITSGSGVGAINDVKVASNQSKNNIKNLKQLANFDLNLAKKLKQQQINNSKDQVNFSLISNIFL